MGFREKLQGAFGDVFDELGGVKSVPDVDRRGLEEIEAEKQRRALEETAPIAQPINNQPFDDPDPEPESPEQSDEPGEPEQPEQSEALEDPESTLEPEPLELWFGETVGEDSEPEEPEPLAEDSAIEAEYEVSDGDGFVFVEPSLMGDPVIEFDFEDDDDDIIVVNPTPAAPEPEPVPVPEPKPAPEPEPAPMPEPDPAPSSAAWAAGIARSIQLEEFGTKPVPKPKEPKAPKPASEPQKAPESIKAPEPQEPPQNLEPLLGATGLSRQEKMQLSDDYSAFVDSRYISQRLLYVLDGAIYEMDSAQRGGLKRYLESVKRSRLQIRYRDALHGDRDNRGIGKSEETLYATEELAMSAVTEDFSEPQSRYLESALKKGTISKSDLVAEVYIRIGDNGEETEISAEDYYSEVDPLADPGIPETPSMLEPDEVHSLAQSVEDIDQERGIDDLIIRLIEQLVFYNTEARQLAEEALDGADEINKPIKRVLWQMDGVEYDTYEAAVFAAYASGDAAFAALMSEEVFAEYVTRLECEIDQNSGERTIISRELASHYFAHHSSD